MGLHDREIIESYGLDADDPDSGEALGWHYDECNGCDWCCANVGGYVDCTANRGGCAHCCPREEAAKVLGERWEQSGMPVVDFLDGVDDPDDPDYGDWYGRCYIGSDGFAEEVVAAVRR